ncbi:PAP2 superfamily protein [Novipirellula galeiformis]|uniref:PAP2 superfamily protein n=1 Tax=Novipirellula galeiformis TaxID=2528004 RepID=A0A5C6C0S8_9BACT|nr:phosphatase PAP2 family protein [Novipirellula galeiformis]TWU17116.1 PAP2 superfamily protein [Novipirellula galeiformis]
MPLPAHAKMRSKLSMFGGADADELAPFRTTSLMWMSGIALLIVPMLTLVDIPVGRWLAENQPSKEVASLLELTGYFSHATGIFLILLCILLMAPRRRRYVTRLAVLAMGAGAVSTLAKGFVLRERPSRINLDIATYDKAWHWVFDWSLDQVANFDAGTRAFPSSNMAVAAAFAIGLAAVLPRGRWVFAIMLLGTMIQRIYSGAHFISDVFGGAAFGLIWAYVCFHPKLLGSLFDRMESERRPRRPLFEEKFPDVNEIRPTENKDRMAA